MFNTIVAEELDKFVLECLNDMFKHKIYNMLIKYSNYFNRFVFILFPKSRVNLEL